MCTLLLQCVLLKAQDEPSLLDALGEDEKTTEYTTNAFKGRRVINAHSIEMLHTGTMDFRILHRFGRVNQGAYQLFGLDQASMRMGFDFGIRKNLMLGIGRSTSKKELDGFLKYRLLWQSKGKRIMPVSAIAVAGIIVNGLKDVTGNPEIPTTFSRRLGYYYSLIVGRKFSDRLTIQVTSQGKRIKNGCEKRLAPSFLRGHSDAGGIRPREKWVIRLRSRADSSLRSE